MRRSAPEEEHSSSLLPPAADERGGVGAQNMRHPHLNVNAVERVAPAPRLRRQHQAAEPVQGEHRAHLLAPPLAPAEHVAALNVAVHSAAEHPVTGLVHENAVNGAALVGLHVPDLAPHLTRSHDTNPRARDTCVLAPP